METWQKIALAFLVCVIIATIIFIAVNESKKPMLIQPSVGCQSNISGYSDPGYVDGTHSTFKRGCYNLAGGDGPSYCRIVGSGETTRLGCTAKADDGTFVNKASAFQRVFTSDNIGVYKGITDAESAYACRDKDGKLTCMKLSNGQFVEV